MSSVTQMQTRYEELCIDFNNVHPNEIWRFVQRELIGAEESESSTPVTTTQKNKDKSSD